MLASIVSNVWGRRVILAGLGAASALGQAPADLWFITPLAFAALFAVFQLARTVRQAFGTGWWFGLGYFALCLRWIIEPFLVDAPTYGWMAPFAIVLMASGSALFWGAAAGIAHRYAPGSMLALVGMIALSEITRSLALTGFPWALIGHVWITTPIAQTAAIWGPHGLTLLTLLVAMSIWRLSQQQYAWVVVPVLIFVAWLPLIPPADEAGTDGPAIRIVQPNIPQNEKWDPAKKASNFARMLSLTTKDAPDLDLIVWPETAIAELLEFAGPSLDIIADVAGGTPLVTGIQRRAHDDVYHNSLILLDLGGEIANTYDKKHLVPFGEYFPGGELAARLGLIGFASSQGFGFTKGETQQLIDIPGVGSARALICYEGIFAEEIATGEGRPRFLLLITNDGWFGKDAGPEQHLAQARLRAIEQGLPMVRAANTGISAVIDGHGRIRNALGLDTSGYIDAVLPPALDRTLYSRFADWPAIGVTLLVIAIGFRRKARIRD